MGIYFSADVVTPVLLLDDFLFLFHQSTKCAFVLMLVKTKSQEDCSEAMPVHLTREGKGIHQLN